MRAVFSVLILGGLVACTPGVPDSASGVGFDNSADAQRARELELTGGASGGQLYVPPTAISDEVPTVPSQPGVTSQPLSATSNGGASADIAAETAAALAATGDGAASDLGAASRPSSASAATSNSAISDENDFGAVSERQTIESDAERIARNREQYQVIAPTAVPSRSRSAQPNIVEYALSTTHPKGTRVHSRSGINLAARAERNCRSYASADLAQIAFLEKGGPDKDRLGLDPDGDGYACDWNPSPYRRAVSN